MPPGLPDGDQATPLAPPGRLRGILREGVWLWLLSPAFALYVVLFAVPLVLLGSLTIDEGLGGVAGIVESPLFRPVAMNTLVISAITTVISTIAGYLTAVAIWRAVPALKAVLLAIVLLPFWTGVLVKTFAWAVLLQDNGVINRALQALGVTSQPVRLLHNRTAVVIGMVHYVLPYTVLPMLAALVGIDRQLERAANSLGASRWRTVWHVTLPLSLPGIYASALLVFIISTGFFITPAVLGSPREMMVANLIEYYSRTLLDLGAASTLAMMVTMAVSLLVFVYQRLPKEGQHGLL